MKKTDGWNEHGTKPESQPMSPAVTAFDAHSELNRLASRTKAAMGWVGESIMQMSSLSKPA